MHSELHGGEPLSERSQHPDLVFVRPGFQWLGICFCARRTMTGWSADRHWGVRGADCGEHTRLSVAWSLLSSPSRLRQAQKRPGFSREMNPCPQGKAATPVGQFAHNCSVDPFPAAARRPPAQMPQSARDQQGRRDAPAPPRVRGRAASISSGGQEVGSDSGSELAGARRALFARRDLEMNFKAVYGHTLMRQRHMAAADGRSNTMQTSCNPGMRLLR
jgi:hypothetical protein